MQGGTGSCSILYPLKIDEGTQRRAQHFVAQQAAVGLERVYQFPLPNVWADLSGTQSVICSARGDVALDGSSDSFSILRDDLFDL